MMRGGTTTGFVASGRFRTGTVVLAVIALFAIFADLVAAEAPVLLWTDGTLHFLPAVTRPAQFAGRPAEEIAAHLAPGDLAVWPLCRHGPTTLDAAGTTRGHPLGTDAFGRDAFARLVHGARTALGLGLAAAIIALVVGGVAGAAAGLLGGYVDRIVARIEEVTGVFPAVVLIALAHALSRKPSMLWIAAIVAIVRASDTARLVRVLVLRSLTDDSAEAVRALGASPARIALRHVLPRIGPQLLASGVFSVGAVVLTETSLSFLGLGVRSEYASWGEMLSEVGLGVKPPMLVAAAAALAVTLGALLLVADAARDVRSGAR